MKNTDSLEKFTFYSIEGTNRKNNVKVMTMIVTDINSNLSFRTIDANNNVKYYVMKCGNSWGIYQYSNNIRVLADCTITPID